ncbi:MAG TPA: hypothetical protein VK882_00770 [Nitrososphaeraceae archaeon]|jgi:hypothetical protein|nr:hypothetical protein [Nitrososphaeraceae archaeon]
MKYYNVGRFGTFTFTIILLSMMVVISLVALSNHQNIYAQSTTNNDSTISTLDDLVKKLVTGVKLENIITVPKEVHVGDTFEVNATVINTLPLNITFIAGNCNSDFSTNLNNIVEEIMVTQCMNRVLPTVLEPGDKVTVQENSGTGKQYKAVAEGEANGNAILLYSIEVKPEGSLLTTSLNSQVVKPFNFTILQ